MAKQQALPHKHIPQRMCVVCRESDAKRGLTRLVRTPEGIVIDPKGKLNGRGAYLCSKPSCWQRALDSEVLAKALRTDVTEDDRARLREVLKTMPQQLGDRDQR